MMNKMRKLLRKLYNRIKCWIGNHDWRYLYGNYQTRKHTFECRRCGKQIEE